MKYECNIQRALKIIFASFVLFVAAPSFAQGQTADTPSEAVRRFYTLLREKHFREGFMMSVYRPAVEGLTDAEMEDLRPDFERTLAAAIPPKIEITGEQASGDTATVFYKSGEDERGAPKIEPVLLVREKGVWIIDDPNVREAVKREGKKFFFNARIAAHESDAEEMLGRIQRAEIAYSVQNGGKFAEIPALIKIGYIPKDIETPDTTGYRYRLELSADAKSYAAFAEPAVYGKTGKLSFYMDAKGLQKKDAGGKPYKQK